MRFLTAFFLFFICSSVTGWAQSLPEDLAAVVKPSRYLLKAKVPSGEVYSTTGRIVKAIALSRPQSLEIARIYLNYIATIKLHTDKSGETTAVVSFQAMKLSGDVVYKGFDIENKIFPSLVSFRLVLPGAEKGTVSAKQVLATVSSANVNNGDCSVSIALHKKVSKIPVIDQLAFYHSEDDFEKADEQMKLIDLYFAAGWLMQRTEKLLDVMQYSQLHDKATFLASNLEVIVLNDWITRQHFNRYLLFKMNDTLNLAKRIEINRFRKKLIDQDFIKLNVIRNEDLLKAANLYADNLANYFDTSQPDLIRATYLAQMAGSRMSSTGYKAIRNFADDYVAVHKHCNVDWRLFVTASTMIRHAMTIQAFLLAEDDQFSEAMGLLNTSANYDVQKGDNRSPADNILIGKLSQRLYVAYLDIALKSLNVGIYRVTIDYYQKAILLKQTYKGMITPDLRERYVADMICKAMLISADKSLKDNDIETTLATYEQVIKLADSARLKNDYVTAKNRLEAISNRPSGFKPWEGVDLVVIVPEKEPVKAKEMALMVPDKNQPEVKDSVAAVSIKTVNSISALKKSRKDGIADLKIKKQLFTKSHAQNIKDSVFLSAVIKRSRANKVKQVVKDSMVMANIDERLRLNQLNNNGKDSSAFLDTIKMQIIEHIAKQNTKDSILLAANNRNFQAIQVRLSGNDNKPVLVSLIKSSLADKSEQAETNIAIVLASDIQSGYPKKSVLPGNQVKTNKKLMINNEPLPVDTVKVGEEKIVESFNISEIKEQIGENIKRIHLEIWSGDTINSVLVLNKTDSLQQLLEQTGDQSFTKDLKVLRINYDELRCNQQKASYLSELDQIRNLLKLNNFSEAGKQLQTLISKTYPVSCKVDKSEAIRLLSTLESPLVYKRWIIQLDSLAKTQEPDTIIAAFEQAGEYYHINALDNAGMEPPDLMTALKSRNETSFLLKAILQLLNTHRPANALELLKEIHKLEPDPDKTFSMQKRLGEMLASGDHSTERSVNDALNAYNINDKWYNELISAYKKQWKMFAK